MTIEDSDVLEVQRDDEQDEEVSIHYDITTYPSDNTLRGIADMWDADEITIPDFQREFVWSIQQSSLLIESFMLGLPVPPVFFYIDDENRNLVIDGQQRILSFVFYFEGFFGFENATGKRQVFRLTGLSEKSPYHRKRFTDLNESDKRKLRSCVLRAINIRQLAPVDNNTCVYHIFERLNTGGTPLRAQEIRNCVFRGGMVELLRELNRDANWRGLLGRRLPDKRQVDIELVLRVFALSNSLHVYQKPMKEFLNQALKSNQTGKSQRCDRFRKVFPQAAKLAYEILGAKPFHVNRPLNTAVLDSVFCTLMDNLERIPSDLSERYAILLADPQFQKMYTASTTDETVVRTRFELAKHHLIG